MKNIKHFILERGQNNESWLGLFLSAIEAMPNKSYNELTPELLANLIIGFGKHNTISEQDVYDCVEFWIGETNLGEDDEYKFCKEIVKRHKPAILKFSSLFLELLNK